MRYLSERPGMMEWGATSIMEMSSEQELHTYCNLLPFRFSLSCVTLDQQ